MGKSKQGDRRERERVGGTRRETEQERSGQEQAPA